MPRHLTKAFDRAGFTGPVEQLTPEGGISGQKRTQQSILLHATNRVHFGVSNDDLAELALWTHAPAGQGKR